MEFYIGINQGQQYMQYMCVCGFDVFIFDKDLIYIHALKNDICLCYKFIKMSIVFTI